MVWPKLTVSDYREMLRKLSFSVFLVTAACIFFLRNQISTVDELFSLLDVTPPINTFKLITIPFGTFVVAIVIAIISESIKLHDRISKLLDIRAVFDVRWILIPMALLSGATVTRERINRIDSDRSRLMADVFYKYASSAKDAEIDGHLITQALTAWSWYWLIIETMVIVIPTAAVLAWFGQSKAAAAFLALALVLLFLMRLFRAEANKYADAEISAILADDDRRRAVRAVFDAL